MPILKNDPVIGTKLENKPKIMFRKSLSMKDRLVQCDLKMARVDSWLQMEHRFFFFLNVPNAKLAGMAKTLRYLLKHGQETGEC